MRRHLLLAASLLSLSSVGGAVPEGGAAVARSTDAELGTVLETIRPPNRSWHIDFVAWIPTKKAAVAAVERGGGEPHLYIVRATARSWRQISIPDTTRCFRSLEIFPAQYGRRSVAFIADCVGPRIRQPYYFERTIKAYSFETGHVEALRPYSLPFAARAFSFDPRDLRSGLVNDGYGLSEHLRWLLPTRLSKPLPLGLDRVGDPVWSPDGRVVMVSGAGGLAAVQGVERTFAEWSLFALDPRSLRLRKLVGGLDQVSRGSFSPDGTIYAVNLPKKSGVQLALLRVSDRRMVMVARGTEGEVAWAGPHAVLAVRHSPERLQLIDVSRALSRLRR